MDTQDRGEIIPIVKLGSSKGLKGHNKIHRDLSAYSTNDQWFRLHLHEWVPISVEYIGHREIKLAQSKSIQDAQALTHTLLGLHASSLPDLEEDEYYVRDLIGKLVITQGNDILGQVQDVHHGPSVDCLIVEDTNSTFYIPMISNYFQAVLEDKIIVDWDREWN